MSVLVLTPPTMDHPVRKAGQKSNRTVLDAA
jgi:hypothetical protein